VAQGIGAKDRSRLGWECGRVAMGACVVNERPELFRVVLSHVPFVM